MLKTEVPRWLNEPPLHDSILALGQLLLEIDIVAIGEQLVELVPVRPMRAFDLPLSCGPMWYVRRILGILFTISGEGSFGWLWATRR